MTLRMNLSRSSAGYYRACCPALPGCSVWAASRKEARDKLRDAVFGYIAHLDVALPREIARLAEHTQGKGV